MRIRIHNERQYSDTGGKGGEGNLVKDQFSLNQLAPLLLTLPLHTEFHHDIAYNHVQIYDKNFACLDSQKKQTHNDVVIPDDHHPQGNGYDGLIAIFRHKRRDYDRYRIFPYACTIQQKDNQKETIRVRQSKKDNQKMTIGSV